MGTFDSDFLSRIRKTLEATQKCFGDNNDYDYILHTFITYVTLTIYSSVVGLIIIILYYVLRPDSDYELSEWSFYRGRILILTVGFCTIGSIVGAMVQAAVMYRRYTVTEEDFCSQETYDLYISLFNTGMISIGLSCVFPVVLFAIPIGSRLE
jgi:hypothetical protein